MRHIRSARANVVYTLPGGTDENDLHVEATLDEEQRTVLVSTWELDDEDRQAVADGARVELLVWGSGHPPVALRLADPV